MNDQVQQMMDVATGVMNGVFISMGKPDVFFKQRIELEPGGVKNLLVVGSVYRDCSDGHCVAVLNPDDKLAEQLKGGVAYPVPILKEMVSGRCKAMVLVLCSDRKTYLASQYCSRKT